MKVIKEMEERHEEVETNIASINTIIDKQAEEMVRSTIARLVRTELRRQERLRHILNSRGPSGPVGVAGDGGETHQVDLVLSLVLIVVVAVVLITLVVLLLIG